jgi:hypothetical protein
MENGAANSRFLLYGKLATHVAVAPHKSVDKSGNGIGDVRLRIDSRKRRRSGMTCGHNRHHSSPRRACT